MRHFPRAFALGLALVVAACDKPAETGTATVDPAASSDSKLSAAIDANSRFGKAMAAAGMASVLDGPGPYTVLIPSDTAFDKLPAGAETTLLEPDGKDELMAVIGTHILPGTMLVEDIRKAVDQGGGTATLPTTGGATLTVKRDGDRLIVSDPVGTKAVLEGDEQHSNGVVHRLDSVLMPAA